MLAHLRGALAFCVPPLSTAGAISPYQLAAMSRPPFRFDNLRSTRTRIAKPVSTATQIKAEDAADGSSRDFARYLGDRHPLRVIFIGHNPSDTSWREAAPYAHKSNRFWRLMEESGLVPKDLAKPDRFTELPSRVGVGFADLFVTSGSDASKVNGGEGDCLRKDVADRILAGTQGIPPKVICCVSKMVAKKMLAGWNGDYGRSGYGRDWGLDKLEDAIVWVLPSTSGRAGLKWVERLVPFQSLAAFVEETPWTDEGTSVTGSSNVTL